MSKEIVSFLALSSSLHPFFLADIVVLDILRRLVCTGLCIPALPCPPLLTAANAAAIHALCAIGLGVSYAGSVFIHHALSTSSFRGHLAPPPPALWADWLPLVSLGTKRAQNQLSHQSAALLLLRPPLPVACTEPPAAFAYSPLPEAQCWV